MSRAGRGGRTFPNKTTREEYEEAYPMPDSFEELVQEEVQAHHNWKEDHRKYWRYDKEGEPVWWCSKCHIPLAQGYFCWARTLVKGTPCRHKVFQPGDRCPPHRGKDACPEGYEPPPKQKRESKHVTSTSQVRQIAWVRVSREKPDAEVKRRASSEMKRGRVRHW
jgi:hypothetical protein